MRLSSYYLPTLKETPASAVAISHQLMLRAGMIRQSVPGIYVLLPLGLSVLSRINNIVREALNAAGCLEMLMPTIQPAELWRQSGRYDDYGLEMLKFKDRHDKDLLYGPTNEEVITDIFYRDNKSHKSLPVNIYQIQWKFRDEIRPRFGLMRGREFLMMDGYSFAKDEEGALEIYDLYYKTYMTIFAKLGIFAVPTNALSGAIGGNLSHEFHVIADTVGESDVFYHTDLEVMIKSGEQDLTKLRSVYAAADDAHDPTIVEGIKSARGIEVGHIFYFGTKYTDSMNVHLAGADNKRITPHMGSYGIGLSRLIAAIIEQSHDEHGIIWPYNVAPFHVHIIIYREDKDVKEASFVLHDAMIQCGLEVLIDDTDSSVGVKFAIADLIGIPYQVKLTSVDMVTIKRRNDGKELVISVDALIMHVKSGNHLDALMV